MKAVILRIAAGILYAAAALPAGYIGFGLLVSGGLTDTRGMVILALIVGIPLALASVLLSFSFKDTKSRRKTFRITVWIIFIGYLVFPFWGLFIKGRRYVQLPWSSIRWAVNLAPFRTIALYCRSLRDGTISRSIIYDNLLGNLLLFAPAGFLPPCLWSGMRKWRVFIPVMLSVLIAVEAIQWFFRLGSCDIDDVILNFTGAAVFFAIWKARFIQAFLRIIYVVGEP